jgi:hypothetical protein
MFSRRIWKEAVQALFRIPPLESRRSVIYKGIRKQAATL